MAFELAVYFWATRKGLDLAHEIKGLPREIKIAGIIFLIGVFFSSVFFSNRWVYSLTISLITVVHLMFAISVAYLLRRLGTRAARDFPRWLAIGLVPLACMTALKFLFPPELSELPFGEIRWDSAIPGFIHLRHFGSWTGAIAAALAVQMLFLDDREEFTWASFWYLVAATLTIWSGTRGAILAIIISVLVTVILTRRLPSFRALGRAAMITGIALCLAFLTILDHHAFYLFRLGGLDSMDAVTSLRTDLWSQTFSKWLEAPMFGWGSGSTFWEVYIGWTHTQPHNVILQFLISWGLVGAIGGFWILGRAIRAAHRSWSNDPTTLPLLALLNALLFQSLLEGMLHYPRFIIAIIVVLAVLIVNQEKRAAV